MKDFFSYAPTENNLLKNYKFYLLISVLALLCSLLGRGSIRELFGYLNTDVDSNVFFTVARMMFEKEAVPYRDAFDHKGPLIYLIDYVALCMGGGQTIFILEFCVYWLSIFLLYLCISKFTSPCIRIASLAIFAKLVKSWIVDGNLPEEFSLPAICFAYYALIVFYEKNHISFLHAFLAGFSLSWILFLKFNCAAVYVVLTGLAVLWYLKNKRFKECLLFISYFLCGCLVLAIPIFIYLYNKQALSHCWNDYIIFNLEYAHLEEKPFTIILMACERLCKLILERSSYMLSFFIIVGVTIMYIASWTKITYKKRVLVIILSLICIANVMVTLPGKYFYDHYFLPIIPLVVLYFILGADNIKNKYFQISMFAIACLAILQIIVAQYLLLKKYTQRKQFEPDPIVSQAIRDNDQTVLVYTGDTRTGVWYRKYNALPSAKYFYCPRVEFKGERLKELLSCFTPEKSPVIFVPSSVQYHKEILAMLETHYTSIQTRDGILYLSATKQ